jgi:hypothetical protein
LPLLQLIGCSAPQSSDVPAVQQPPVAKPIEADRPITETAAVETAALPFKEIVISRVVAENPVRVEGEARTFENNVAIRIRDAAGKIIVEQFETSVGDSGHRNPFRAEVFLTRNPGGRITVEALEYSAKDGSERSQVSQTVDYRVPSTSARLFFPAVNPTDCARVSPVVRAMPKTVSLARALTEALVRGPIESEAGLSNPFPRGSDVNSVILRSGVLTVDLNDRLQNVGGSCAALAIRASLERTLKELPAVREVIITAGGSRELALQP